MNPIIAATAKPSTVSGNDGKTLPPVAGTRGRSALTADHYAPAVPT